MKRLVGNELWHTIEPLLTPELPKPKGGRPRIDNRATLVGIIYVLKVMKCGYRTNGKRPAVSGRSSKEEQTMIGQQTRTSSPARWMKAAERAVTRNLVAAPACLRAFVHQPHGRTS